MIAIFAISFLVFFTVNFFINVNYRHFFHQLPSILFTVNCRQFYRQLPSISFTINFVVYINCIKKIDEKFF